MVTKNHRYMKKLVVVILVLSLSASVCAQLSDRADLDAVTQNRVLGVRPAASPFSLLDFSRIRWSHSYSVSFFSGGNNSGSLGLLTSNMTYELSSKLSLCFKLGVAHSGGPWSMGREATLLPGFRLDYHPSEKFRLVFMVERLGGLYDPFAHRSSSWHNPSGP